MSATGSRGGKRQKVRASGYYKNNNAGNRMGLIPKDAGNDRAFKGSGIKNYIFFNTTHGTRTIPAHNYQEALRIAESLGYTRGDYKKR